MALTEGENPDDFNGYESGEGALISGGVEYFSSRRSVEEAKKMAERFLEIAEFCKWLRTVQGRDQHVVFLFDCKTAGGFIDSTQHDSECLQA